MMHLLRIAVVVAVVCWVAAAGRAAPTAAKPPADPVAELQSQDSAFSLLIECYRQLQLSLIEIEYEHVLDEADKISDATARNLARAAAERTAEERIQRLGRDMENMVVAYQSSRAKHEQELGRRVPHRVDRHRAARSLRGYIAFEPSDRGGARMQRNSPPPRSAPLGP